MLGHKICQEFPRRGHEVTGTIRTPLPKLRELLSETRVIAGVDALDGDTVERVVQRERPEFVINAVGIVKQREAASDRYLSAAINVWLPHRLARTCRDTGSRLIHISTDCVFSGRKGGYSEADPSDAQDLYGKSKYLGEPDASEKAAITIRSSIIGREVRRPTHGLVEWFLGQQGRSVRGFAKAIYTGFTTIEMARIIAIIIEKHPVLHGVHHVASAPISKFDLLHLVRKELNLDIDVQRDEDFVCDRSLMMKPFTEQTGYRAPAWPEMIREMCADPTPYDTLQKLGTE